MTRFLVSLLVSIGLSGFVAYELGWEHYGPIAVIVTLTLLAMFSVNEHAQRKLQKLVIERRMRDQAIDFMTRLGLALYLGVTWPSLPYIIWIGRGRAVANTFDPAAESSGQRSKSERE